ncbi:hypothetical protein NQZ68_014887 [Dissostichus eleginoides]|nr:hypothetical protein NQZ68_014887 [Dissostichus eleginoides]
MARHLWMFEINRRRKQRKTEEESVMEREKIVDKRQQKRKDAASVSCLLRYVMFEMRYLIKSIHLHRVEQDPSRWRHANSFIPLRWCDTEADSCRCRLSLHI